MELLGWASLLTYTTMGCAKFAVTRPTHALSVDIDSSEYIVLSWCSTAVCLVDTHTQGSICWLDIAGCALDDCTCFCIWRSYSWPIAYHLYSLQRHGANHSKSMYSYSIRICTPYQIIVIEPVTNAFSHIERFPDPQRRLQVTLSEISK